MEKTNVEVKRNDIVYNFHYSDGSLSSIETLDSMTELLLVELLEDENPIETRSSYYQQGWTDEEMIDFIESCDVKVTESPE